MPEEIDHDDEECTCIPSGAIVTAEVRAIEYMDTETGKMWKVDLSNDGSGGPLDPDKLNSMTTWLEQVNSVPMLAALMHEMYCHGHDEEEE